MTIQFKSILTLSTTSLLLAIGGFASAQQPEAPALDAEIVQPDDKVSAPATDTATLIDASSKKELVAEEIEANETKTDEQSVEEIEPAAEAVEVEAEENTKTLDESVETPNLP